VTVSRSKEVGLNSPKPLALPLIVTLLGLLSACTLKRRSNY